MKETQAQKKARLVRLLHVAKGQLMMGDADYRTLLANVSRGKTSSKQLGVAELEAALKAMKARGFVVTTKATKQDKPDIPVYDGVAQIRKIRALWLQLHRLGEVKNPSELSLARFVKRMTGVDYHGWLDTDNASKVIEHLKQWIVRVGGAVK